MIIRTATLLLVLLSVGGCANRAAQEQARKTEAFVMVTTIPVRVVQSRTADLAETLAVTGSFTASQESAVGPSVSGRLVAVYVRDGDAVRPGQAIAQQETVDQTTLLRDAQAQSDAARAALQKARATARVAPARSASNVKTAEARLAQARARYKKAQAGSREEERTQAQWAVRRAKSDLDTAKTALDRAQRLYAEGAIARVELEAAQNRHENALAAHEGALQNLRIVEAATRPEDLEAARQEVLAAEGALRAAQADQRLDVNLDEEVQVARANLVSAQERVRLALKALNDLTIRSPFSGRISGRPVQAGTYVAPGSVVATVVGLGGTYFEANVAERNIARVKPGSPVELTVDALGAARFSGKVVALNPQASEEGRVYGVRIDVREAIPGIKPGMFGRGTIRLGTRVGATVVPAEAVVRDGEHAYVFVVEGDKAKRIEVKTGLSEDSLIEVGGLLPGQTVVVAGQSGLVDGAAVKVEQATAKGA